MKGPPATLLALVLLLGCATGPVPTPAPSGGPGPSNDVEPMPSGSWPPFMPLEWHEMVVTAFNLECAEREGHVRCAGVRDSGARFETDGPVGTAQGHLELTFTAIGPPQLEPEARRLFAVVADIATGDVGRSSEWQDQIWARFADQDDRFADLPNGARWSAGRQAPTSDLTIWRLTVAWQTATSPAQ